jgi:DNA anti-recombination protein RmuC
MQRVTLRIVLYLLLVFLSGLAVGAFGYRFVSVTPVAAAKASVKPSPEEWRKQYLKEMESRLKLTSDQLQHLNQILDETQQRSHEAHVSHNQVMKTIKQEQSTKVHAMLTDVQRAEYEKLHAEREQRAKAASGK